MYQDRILDRTMLRAKCVFWVRMTKYHDDCATGRFKAKNHNLEEHLENRFSSRLAQQGRFLPLCTFFQKQTSKMTIGIKISPPVVTAVGGFRVVLFCCSFRRCCGRNSTLCFLVPLPSILHGMDISTGSTFGRVPGKVEFA